MEVPIRCICPPRDGEVRHPEGDTVTLSDRPSFREATAMRNSVAIAVAESGDGADFGFDESLATLTEAYLVHGIKSWTLRRDTEDPKGRPLLDQPIPVSRKSIEEFLLSQFDVAWEVGEAADDIYSKLVMLPLLVRGSKSSPVTPTEPSMSPPTPRSIKPRKPSKPSSTSTSLTVVTDATSQSLDGDSSLSPSSTSAA